MLSGICYCARCVDRAAYQVAKKRIQQRLYREEPHADAGGRPHAFAVHGRQAVGAWNEHADSHEGGEAQGQGGACRGGFPNACENGPNDRHEGDPTGQ
jgi:hypothetical protein